jgi:hypothetical protein
MSAALDAVAAARAYKSAAEMDYLDAMLTAHQKGHSFAEIGRAAGVSRQAVRELIVGREARANSE